MNKASSVFTAFVETPRPSTCETINSTAKELPTLMNCVLPLTLTLAVLATGEAPTRRRRMGSIPSGEEILFSVCGELFCQHWGK